MMAYTWGDATSSQSDDIDGGEEERGRNKSLLLLGWWTNIRQQLKGSGVGQHDEIKWKVVVGINSIAKAIYMHYILHH